MFETILFTIEDKIARITFNREASGNAFSETMLRIGLEGKDVKRA